MAVGNDGQWQKKRLYDDLEALNGYDEAPDSGRSNSQQAWRNSQKADASPPVRTKVRSLFARSVSDTRPHVQSQFSPKYLTIVPPSTDPNPSTLSENKQITPAKNNFSHPSTADQIIPKQKRKNVVCGQVPEDSQLFRNLHFYFFPNNSTNSARRLRIAKAQQYGAIWQRSWTNEITHVIVDKDLTFPELLRFLGVGSLPDATTVVSEDYPAECLSFNKLLDPKQIHFAVKGAPQVQVPSVESTNSSQRVRLTLMTTTV